jgi:hypothetical protein
MDSRLELSYEQAGSMRVGIFKKVEWKEFGGVLKEKLKDMGTRGIVEKEELQGRVSGPSKGVSDRIGKAVTGICIRPRTISCWTEELWELYQFCKDVYN